MWTFDGTSWYRDDAATPEHEERRDESTAWGRFEMPRLQVVEIRREDTEERLREILPWLRR